MNSIMAYTCLNLDTPCAVSGKSGMPFFNPAMEALIDSPLALELFLAQEQKARESRQYFSGQNVGDYGPEQIRQPYLFDFSPQFDCVDDQSEEVESECIGSMLECVDGEAPRPATFEPDRRFTEKEQKIIFFALHGFTSKDIWAADGHLLPHGREPSASDFQQERHAQHQRAGDVLPRKRDGPLYPAFSVVAIKPRSDSWRCRMMYLKVKFIRNTDHPHGRKTLEGYIAAESKTVAKVKAAEYLYEQDGKFAIYYKAPRFEEITEELYISKTEQQLDHVDESAIKQYCALLSLFGEQDNYEEDECGMLGRCLITPRMRSRKT